jgi:hypothetical protein
MAVQGYCLAKVDTSNAQPGQRLVVNGGTLSRSLSTTAVATLVGISPDIGVLLRNTGSDTLMPVYLTR